MNKLVKISGIMILTILSLITALSAQAKSLAKPTGYIDLNHPLVDGMTTYPGESLVKHFTPHPRYSNGALVDGLTVLGISATYIDSPHHIDEKKGNISDYPLKKLVNLPIQVIKLLPGKRTFDIEDVKNYDVKGKAVLFYTQQDRYFGKPQYAINSPYLSKAVANWLVSQHAALVGIDALLVDNPDTPAGVPVHDVLLSKGIVIAKDMTNIGSVLHKNAWLTAVPPRAPTTSFPARIFASIY